MGGNSSSSEQQQRPHSAGTSVNRGANSSRRAEREAQLCRERRPLVDLQTSHARMAEEIAQLRKEMRAERKAQLRRERMFHSSVEAFGSGLTLMNDSFIRPQQRSLPRRAVRLSILFGVLLWSYTYCSLPRLMDFSSSVKKVVVSDDEGLVESPDDLSAVRLSILFGVLLWSYTYCFLPRWVDLYSDVSAVKDFNKLLDDLRSDFSSSEKKHVVADDEDWVKSPDDQVVGSWSLSQLTLVERRSTPWTGHQTITGHLLTWMATGSLESNDSGVSLKSDRSKAGWIDFKDRVSPRPDFSSSEEEDVSDDEDLVQSRDAQREDDILPYMYPWSDDCDWMELADNLT